MSIKIIKDTEPAMDEFYMPGEYEHHDGCIIIWPFRPGSWKKDRTDAETAFSEVIKAISRSEHVYVVAESESEVKRVQKYLQDVSNTISGNGIPLNVLFLTIEYMAISSNTSLSPI